MAHQIMRRKTGNLTGFLSSAAAEHERRARARPNSKDFPWLSFLAFWAPRSVRQSGTGRRERRAAVASRAEVPDRMVPCDANPSPSRRDAGAQHRHVAASATELNVIAIGLDHSSARSGVAAWRLLRQLPVYRSLRPGEFCRAACMDNVECIVCGVDEMPRLRMTGVVKLARRTPMFYGVFWR
jgi:hypothetical protein